MARDEGTAVRTHVPKSDVTLRHGATRSGCGRRTGGNLPVKGCAWGVTGVHGGELGLIQGTEAKSRLFDPIEARAEIDPRRTVPQDTSVSASFACNRERYTLPPLASSVRPRCAPPCWWRASVSSSGLKIGGYR